MFLRRSAGDRGHDQRAEIRSVARFVNPDAEFIYVPPNDVSKVAKDVGGTPYDIKGVIQRVVRMIGDVTILNIA